ncbi:hypothetical protein CHS0354_034087, partial [Potamilus streckersoni]
MGLYTTKYFIKVDTYVAWESLRTRTRRPTTQQCQFRKNHPSQMLHGSIKQHLKITLIESVELLSILYWHLRLGGRENQTPEETCAEDT